MRGGGCAIEGSWTAAFTGAGFGLIGGAGSILAKPTGGLVAGALSSGDDFASGALAGSTRSTPSGVSSSEAAFPSIKEGASGGPTAGLPFPQKVKDAAYDQNPGVICVYCRMTATNPQVDHVIPRSRGGNATLENAQIACRHCNASKGARDYPVNPPPGYAGAWPPKHW